MPIDPVCGMVVEEEHSYGCSTYKGRHYCFCSDECREEFEENPEDFVDIEEPSNLEGD